MAPENLGRGLDPGSEFPASTSPKYSGEWSKTIGRSSRSVSDSLSQGDLGSGPDTEKSIL
jgi:hypothetical protein